MLDLKKIRKFLSKNIYSIKLIVILLFVIIITVYITIESIGTASETNNNDAVNTVTPDTVVKEVFIEVEKEPIYFQDTDFYEMTKSQLIERKECIEQIINNINELQLEDTSFVEQANNEINKINNALENKLYLYPYSDSDLDLMAYMMFDEAGDASDEEQQLVGCVILNRHKMNGISGKLENPTLLDIINEKGQYYIGVKNNHKFDLNKGKVTLDKIPEECYSNAKIVLEHQYTCPDNVVYQSLQKQGSGVYKSFYHGAPYNNTTYFCYL